MRLVCLLLIISSHGLAAEIFNCGENLYATTAIHASCVPVRSGTACGGDGNKYYAPSKYQQTNAAYCESSRAESPIVNMKKVALYKASQKQKAAQSKAEKADRVKMQKADFNQGKFSSAVKLDNLPPVAEHIVGQYQSIWKSYDKLLEGVDR